MKLGLSKPTGQPTLRKTIKTHYQKVASFKFAWPAWQAIRENGVSSKSHETRDEIKKFEKDLISNLQSLVARLSKKTFKFVPAKGIAKKRKDKKSRPIVMAPLESRIVQRAILDVIQSEQRAKEVFDSEFSFGGLPGKGVKDGVLCAQKFIRNGHASYYICSDISGFFTDIKRSKVQDEISKIFSDSDFLSLFEKAMVTELANIAELKENADLFPIHEIGVAQGCCLSPLVGNIYLKDFDRQMNSPDVLCLRYVDDFLILGPSQKVVNAKFKLAKRLLGELGLSAYEPEKNSNKAHEGDPKKGFNYLVCCISSSTIKPSSESWQKLHSMVQATFQDALSGAKSSDDYVWKFTDVSVSISRRLEGWIKQYKFCIDDRVIGQWNQILQTEFLDFQKRFYTIADRQNPKRKAELLGYYNIHQAFLDIKIKSI